MSPLHPLARGRPLRLAPGLVLAVTLLALVDDVPPPDQHRVEHAEPT
jgi:hypothetical protein